MKIKKATIANSLLLLIGIFCQVNPLMSKTGIIIYLVLCLFLFILSVNFKTMKLGIGFFWYFFFVVFCLFTLTYTINTINPDYVYTRIIAYLALLFLSAPFLSKKENIKTLVTGFFFGGLIGITIVIVSQYNLIGVGRLGSGNLYGSYAEFGAICSLTMTSFYWLQKDSNMRNSLKIIIFAYLTAALVLSGARKALLISMLLPLFMHLFDKRKRMTKKILFVSIASLASLLIIYASLNNNYLYKTIGYRIESGIASVLGENKEDASLYERNSFKTLAKEMVIEKPLVGWGIHGFAIKNYYAHDSSPKFLLYSHDGFLEILSCYGLIGFALYYWIFLYIFINRKKLLQDNTGIFLFSYSVIALIMELYSISYLHGYLILLIAACGNIISKEGKLNEENK